MMGCEPFVLKNTGPWRRRGRRPGSDDSDMNAAGWSTGFYGRSTEINDDVMAQYLDLEYYRGGFDDLKRLLPLLAFRDLDKIDTWEYNYNRKRIIAEYEAEAHHVNDAFNLTHLSESEVNCLVKGEALYDSKEESCPCGGNSSSGYPTDAEN